jgi:hypothetical protein
MPQLRKHAMSRCKQCNQPLVEIDNYGERLIGCIECNQWTWRGSKRLIELARHDLEALKGVKKKRPQEARPEAAGKRARSLSYLALQGSGKEGPH